MLAIRACRGSSERPLRGLAARARARAGGGGGAAASEGTGGLGLCPRHEDHLDPPSRRRFRLAAGSGIASCVALPGPFALRAQLVAPSEDCIRRAAKSARIATRRSWIGEWGSGAARSAAERQAGPPGRRADASDSIGRLRRPIVTHGRR